MTGANEISVPSSTDNESEQQHHQQHAESALLLANSSYYYTGPTTVLLRRFVTSSSTVPIHHQARVDDNYLLLTNYIDNDDDDDTGDDNMEQSRPTMMMIAAAPPVLASSLFEQLRNDLYNNKRHLITDNDLHRMILGGKLVGDVVIAAMVSSIIAPFITVIDKGIVERISSSSSNSSGNRTSLLSSISRSIVSIVQNPITYFKSPTYLWMLGTYTATYSAANTLRTITSNTTTPTMKEIEIKATTTTTTSKTTSSFVSPAPLLVSSTSILFVGTTVVNSGVSILKDRAYAKMFGTSSSSASTLRVPYISYGLWLGRDCTVIGSSFLLPSYISPMIQDATGLSRTDATRVAQLVSPVAAQLIASPFHSLGLEYCTNNTANASTSLTLRDRYQRFQQRLMVVRNSYKEIVTARMIRVLPGYSIGGVYNTQYRTQWHNYLDDYHRKMISSTTTAATTAAVATAGVGYHHHHSSSSSTTTATNRHVRI